MERSITMTSLVRAEDRAAVRDMISSIRTLRPYAAGEELVEASVRTRHGADQPVLVSVRRSRDGSAPCPTLYWELRVPGASPTSTPSATATQGAEPASTAVAFATALADAVAEFARTESPTKLLESVITAAARIVTPAAAVGGLLVRSRGRIEMISGTGTVAATCDRLQGTAESGPALDAASLAMPVVVDDLRTDERWPEFGFRASQAGVGSMLAVPMTGPRGVFGALTFYATDPQAFSAEFVALAAAYGTHAGMAVGHAELEANLRVGLETREEIGRAVGIIMERHRLNPTGAFDLLVFASQRAHMKLRDVAAWVNETGEDPENLILVRSRGHN
jgi:GAF domain-containing protein